jgi:hypothetical protein
MIDQETAEFLDSTSGQLNGQRKGTAAGSQLSFSVSALKHVAATTAGICIGITNPLTGRLIVPFFDP